MGTLLYLLSYDFGWSCQIFLGSFSFFFSVLAFLDKVCKTCSLVGLFFAVKATAGGWLHSHPTSLWHNDRNREILSKNLTVLPIYPTHLILLLCLHSYLCYIGIFCLSFFVQRKKIEGPNFCKYDSILKAKYVFWYKEKNMLRNMMKRFLVCKSNI